MKIKKSAKVINHPQTEITPIDLAISRHIQNMYATYGEAKVRASLKDLFSMEFRPVKRKVS